MSPALIDLYASIYSLSRSLWGVLCRLSDGHAARSGSSGNTHDILVLSDRSDVPGSRGQIRRAIFPLH